MENIDHKISTVQNYFINKILNSDFDVLKIEKQKKTSNHLIVLKIDTDKVFQFLIIQSSIEGTPISFTIQRDSFMTLSDLISKRELDNNILKIFLRLIKATQTKKLPTKEIKTIKK